jgi:PAS domain-containing protein
LEDTQQNVHSITAETQLVDGLAMGLLIPHCNSLYRHQWLNLGFLGLFLSLNFLTCMNSGDLVNMGECILPVLPFVTMGIFSDAKNETLLRERTSYLKAALNEFEDAVIIIDQDDNMLEMNHAGHTLMKEAISSNKNSKSIRKEKDMHNQVFKRFHAHHKVSFAYHCKVSQSSFLFA